MDQLERARVRQMVLEYDRSTPVSRNLKLKIRLRSQSVRAALGVESASS